MKTLFTCLLYLPLLMEAQQSNVYINGKISGEDGPIAYATVIVEGEDWGTAADADGYFELNIPEGDHVLKIQAVGFIAENRRINTGEFENKPLEITLREDQLGLDEVVISATRNRVNRKQAPVVVNVLGPKLFNAVQSVSVAESLNYQPGVRVETNCQNCGFTQVRLNGLDGSYTQVLVNNRAVFSALNSVYGLEQIPTSLLDRIEVVRSGGSALYGSNAIAGTINIITKDPVLNSWQVSSTLGLINAEVADKTINMDATVVSEDLSSGITVFGMKRDRGSYDANADGFTEITALTNTTLGAKAFMTPGNKSKLTLDFTALEEYRRGGNRLDLAPHLTDITEALDHNIIIGGLTYDIHNIGGRNFLSLYSSGQYTGRKSYYGGLGGGRTRQDSIAAANSYGNTDDLSFLTGGQFTRNFLDNQDVLTVGTEYNLNSTQDNIPGYERTINQEVHSVGAFAQYEWKPAGTFTALLGGRVDYVHVEGDYTVQDIYRTSSVEKTVFSPRITLMYRPKESWMFRGGYARGFRAPQAFNEDLHISSVGGEPQFVILSQDLTTEFSNAFTASLNFSRNFNNLQSNFLLEGFYTELQNPFTTVSTGASLPNGSILQEVRNGSGAYVAGTNVELGISPSSRSAFMLGGTLQKSRYKKAQVLFDTKENNAQEPDVVISEFVRNPEFYGYFNINLSVLGESSIDLTGTYTGSMIVPLVISETGYVQLNKSNPFYDVNIKLNHHIHINENLQVNIFGGVQNIFDSYQDDFDTGPTRDSGYVYGPSLPRSVYFGLKFGNLHNL
ncbi:TonB-dependent receptor [Salinimicrobium sp. GXAS 041]|uniref:TonB-dependent receptor n=1 Tax=Salinimicrobium sp. GXAS 041 TaxID=3400806 RepID=UPI003C74FCAF